MRDHRGLDQSEVRGTLKRKPTEPTGLSGGLGVGCERERGSENDSKAFGQVNWMGGVISQDGEDCWLGGGGRRQRTGAHLGCLSLMSIGYLSEGVKYALRYMGRDWGNSNRYQQIDGV